MGIKSSSRSCRTTSESLRFSASPPSTTPFDSKYLSQPESPQRERTNDFLFHSLVPLDRAQESSLAVLALTISSPPFYQNSGLNLSRNPAPYTNMTDGAGRAKMLRPARRDPPPPHPSRSKTRAPTKGRTKATRERRKVAPPILKDERYRKQVSVCEGQCRARKREPREKKTRRLTQRQRKEHRTQR